MKDNENELFPVVDEEGNILGSISRGKAHDGSRVLHPVVHLHIFNRAGDLYLQKRPKWKDVQPDMWDTACGGHVDLGENVDRALRREVHEELGIVDFDYTFLGKYVFDSKRERELVYVHKAVYDGAVVPDKDELADGRFWRKDEIIRALGTNVFTPNFESEYRHFFMDKELD